MPKFACIPSSSEAPVKFRGGLRELCSFVASAPCGLACLLFRVHLLLVGSARVFSLQRPAVVRLAECVLFALVSHGVELLMDAALRLLQ